MIQTLQKLLVTAAIACAGLLVAGQESESWIFEGLITDADPSLAPDLQSGWVLAGSFQFTPLEMEEEPVEAGLRAGRLAGGIANAELTIDLYYQLHFEAQQVPGLVGIDYQDNDPEREGRDLLGWFFPMQGQLKESGWSSRWLQVWLADPEGKMIRAVPPTISPYGVEWKHGWFRLTFARENGETAHVDGRIDFFGPESSLETDETGGWKDAATRLSGILMERDSTISNLRAELSQTQARLDGLRQMVDLLVQERSHLQNENALLQEKAKQVDPEIEATLAELTSEKSLLEEQINTLSGRNNALAESLAASEQDRLLLMDRLAELEKLATAGPTESAPKSAAGPLLFEGKPAGTMTIV